MKCSFLLLIFGLFVLSLQAEEGNATPESLNDALGYKLFQDENLWDDDAEEVGKRLGWSVEGKTPTLISFRKYTKADVRCLGARPYSVALYGEPGKTTRLSLMFANKGDLEEANPSDAAQEDNNKSIEVHPDKILKELKQTQKLLDQHVKADAETIINTLTPLLGEPRQSFFVTRATKETLSRWDWKGHAFLLSAPKGEYVSLRLMSSQSAENNGKTSQIPDSELREILLNQVEKRSQGDVVIHNIPMVDQGPKGYCVPATLERVMRVMGIPADM